LHRTSIAVDDLQNVEAKLSVKNAKGMLDELAQKKELLLSYQSGSMLGKGRVDKKGSLDGALRGMWRERAKRATERKNVSPTCSVHHLMPGTPFHAAHTPIQAISM